MLVCKQLSFFGEAPRGKFFLKIIIRIKLPNMFSFIRNITNKNSNSSNISAVTDPILIKLKGQVPGNILEPNQTVKMPFVQATFVLSTFVHIRYISAVTDQTDKGQSLSKLNTLDLVLFWLLLLLFLLKKGQVENIFSKKNYVQKIQDKNFDPKKNLQSKNFGFKKCCQKT